MKTATGAYKSQAARRLKADMKILMVLKRFDPSSLFGGAERSAFRLASQLATDGLDVEITGARKERSWPARDRIPAGGGHICVTRLRHPAVRFIGTLTYNLLLLKKILAERKSRDIVHVHFASFEMMTAALARLLGGPPVVCKIACSGRSGEISTARRKPWFPIFRALMRRVDLFISLSDDVTGELRRAGIEPERIRRIPNGLDTSVFSPSGMNTRGKTAETTDIPDDAKVILFTGRLSAQKNLDVLLRALPGLSKIPWALLVAGKGPERERLESLASRCGISGRVRFLGPVADVAPLYRAADIFVLPSRDEGLSNSLLEAMSAGLAVVATRVGGSGEAIEDGVNGFLASPGDVVSLAAALEKAMSADAASIGRKARATVVDRYSIRRVAKMYARVYGELAEAEKDARPREPSGPSVSPPEGAVARGGGHRRPLFLINSYPPRIGGAERLVESLVSEFVKARIPCTVVTRLSGRAQLVEKTGLATVIRIPVSGPVPVRSAIFRAAASFFLFALRGRYDCIHAHSLDSPAVIGAFMSKAAGKRLFVTIHNIGKVEALRTRFDGERALRRIIESADAIISINGSIGRDLLLAGCPPEKIVHIPNGVDTSAFVPLDDGSRLKNLSNMGTLGRTIFLFVGNFHGQKGIDTLIRAWRILETGNPDSGAMLLLAGDGVLLDEMKGLAASLGLGDSTRFLGRRPDVKSYMQLADVFVQPSRWEGLSIALLEAMSCALPVIATPVGGTVELIADGIDGILVPADDPARLAGCMERLLRDQVLRKALGARARAKVAEGYSIKQCAVAHMDLFDGKLPERKHDDEIRHDQKSGPAADERDKQASGEEAEELSGRLS